MESISLQQKEIAKDLLEQIKTNGLLLCQYEEVPWRNIKGMRDHIAHGYFDINVDFIWDVIQNDLTPLKHAVDYLINYCE